MHHCQPVSEHTSNNLDLVTKVDLVNGKRLSYDKKRRPANQHLGQRKLLLSEVQFLSMYYSRNTKHPVVLYVGAAPGSHLLFLHALFPHVKFFLYDGAPFDARLRLQPDVFELHNKFFTLETCLGLRSTLPRSTLSNLLFISDIRLSAASSIKFERQVQRDMEQQADWVRALRPQYSLLKFRFPYLSHDAKPMSYLKGDLYYGVWPKATSGETRLLVSRSGAEQVQKYDFKAYEENLHFHNVVRRRHCFAGQLKLSEDINKLIEGGGYCSCYDCLSELTIFKTYNVKAMPQQLNVNLDLQGVVQLYADMFTNGKIVFPGKK